MADAVNAPASHRRHELRKLLEPGGAGEEDVERWVAQQLQGERQTLAGGTAAGSGRGGRPHLARANAQAPRVEDAA